MALSSHAPLLDADFLSCFTHAIDNSLCPNCDTHSTRQSLSAQQAYSVLCNTRQSSKGSAPQSARLEQLCAIDNHTPAFHLATSAWLERSPVHHEPSQSITVFNSILNGQIVLNATDDATAATGSIDNLLHSSTNPSRSPNHTSTGIPSPVEEMSNYATVGLWLFVALLIFRYFRTIVSIFAFNLYQPKPVLSDPTFTPGDVSVIIPTTFKTPPELVKCVQRIMGNAPAAAYIVTAEANVELVKDTIATHCDNSKIAVLGVDKLNKRNQILKALEYVTTKITVLADDDVFWPDNYLSYLLAIFEDPEVGAGGTRQRVHRNDKPDMWNILGIGYLERRVWNNVTTNAIDGSLSTLSGRTAAYRSKILQDDDFKQAFSTDSWGGKVLNSDDDKCLTRYVYSHGWNIALQFDPRSVIETTVEGDRKYLDQCLRWARAHWRGNFTVMRDEKYWCSPKYFWGLYYIYIGQFQTPALLIDGLLYFYLSMAVSAWSMKTALASYLGLAAWIFFTKILKMIPHFRRYPQDMKFIPLLIAFSYFHGVLNLYALCTMHATHWGSQNLSNLQQARTQTTGVVPLLHTMDTEVSADGSKRKTT